MLYNDWYMQSLYQRGSEKATVVSKLPKKSGTGGGAPKRRFPPGISKISLNKFRFSVLEQEESALCTKEKRGKTDDI